LDKAICQNCLSTHSLERRFHPASPIPSCIKYNIYQRDNPYPLSAERRHRLESRELKYLPNDLTAKTANRQDGLTVDFWLYGSDIYLIINNKPERRDCRAVRGTVKADKGLYK
jgi:hypothetical protein